MARKKKVSRKKASKSVVSELNKFLTVKLRMDKQREFIFKEEIKLKKIKAVYSEKEKALIKLMGKEKLEEIVGQRGGVSINKKEYATAKDWKKVYTWIKKTNSFDILQKRLNNAAVLDRLEDKIRIPGMGLYIERKLKVQVK